MNGSRGGTVVDTTRTPAVIAEERSNLLSTLKTCVKAVVAEYIQEGQHPISEESDAYMAMFEALEMVFMHGLKEPKFWSSAQFGFWNFITENEKKLPVVLQRSIPFIKKLSNVRNTLGRGRAWVRLALNEKALEEYMNELLSDKHKNAQKAWYEEWAIFRQDEDRTIFIQLVVGLNPVEIRASVNDLRLNGTLYRRRGAPPSPAPTRSKPQPRPVEKAPTPTPTTPAAEPAEEAVAPAADAAVVEEVKASPESVPAGGVVATSPPAPMPVAGSPPGEEPPKDSGFAAATAAAGEVVPVRVVRKKGKKKKKKKKASKVAVIGSTETHSATVDTKSAVAAALLAHQNSFAAAEEIVDGIARKRTLSSGTGTGGAQGGGEAEAVRRAAEELRRKAAEEEARRREAEAVQEALRAQEARVAADRARAEEQERIAAEEAVRKADEERRRREEEAEAAEEARRREEEAAAARARVRDEDVRAAAHEAVRRAAAEEEARREAARKREDEELAAAVKMAEEEAEAQRKAEEEAEAQRKAEEEAEALRKAEEEAEALRRAEEAAAKRKAEEEAEALRKAEEEAEALRKAEEEAEALRKAEEEAEALRKAEEEAEALRKAEEAEALRKAEEAEALRKAEEEAEALRKAEEEAAAAAKAPAEEPQQQGEFVPAAQPAVQGGGGGKKKRKKRRKKKKKKQQNAVAVADAAPVQPAKTEEEPMPVEEEESTQTPVEEEEESTPTPVEEPITPTPAEEEEESTPTPVEEEEESTSTPVESTQPPVEEVPVPTTATSPMDVPVTAGASDSSLAVLASPPLAPVTSSMELSDSLLMSLAGHSDDDDDGDDEGAESAATAAAAPGGLSLSTLRASLEGEDTPEPAAVVTDNYDMLHAGVLRSFGNVADEDDATMYSASVPVSSPLLSPHVRRVASLGRSPAMRRFQQSSGSPSPITPSVEVQHMEMLAYELLDPLVDHPHIAPFLVPVQGDSDYKSIVQRPMDLGTVSSKLNQHVYTSLAEVVDDVHLTFDNTMLFHAYGSRLHTTARQLRDMFDAVVARSQPAQNLLRRAALQKRHEYSDDERAGDEAFDAFGVEFGVEADARSDSSSEGTAPADGDARGAAAEDYSDLALGRPIPIPKAEPNEVEAAAQARVLGSSATATTTLHDALRVVDDHFHVPEPAARLAGSPSAAAAATLPPGWPTKSMLILGAVPKRGLSHQGGLCAGCGVPLKSGFFSSVRFCEYSSRYYCNACHLNEDSVVPARLLFHEDDDVYKVCHAAKRYLDSIYDKPLINVVEVAPELVERCKEMKHAHLLRQQLMHIRAFLMTCREKERLLAAIGDRRYMLHEASMYSLRDLVDLFDDRLLPWLLRTVEVYVAHVTHKCELCRAKGFFCEYCDRPEPIFSFQLLTVTQCPRCMACFHRSCFSEETCPKCARIRRRKHHKV